MVRTRPSHVQKIIVDEPVESSSLLIIILVILTSLGQEGLQLSNIEPNIIINLIFIILLFRPTEDWFWKSPFTMCEMLWVSVCFWAHISIKLLFTEKKYIDKSWEIKTTTHKWGSGRYPAGCSEECLHMFDVRIWSFHISWCQGQGGR